MSGISTQCRWFLGMAIGGAIALSANCALAQIKPVPDNTLGAESSIVTPNVVINSIPSDRIDGGAIRGRNLFHSFQEFNIDSGRGAYFTNPAGIENIFSRVTGSNASKILGTLGVLGNANLFLINPNGIVFKDNAALDIRGSFVASTARSLVFADGTQFSTTKPQTAPLLTVSVPIGLQFETSPSGIQVQDVNLLDVQSGVTRALVGGDVVLDDSGLRARGGRVELGGLAEAGTVNLAVNNNDISLNFPATAARADVSLLNGSVVNVLAGGGGSITVNAQNLNLKGGSNLKAGIASNLGSVDSKAGDININATGAIKLTDGSFINNLVGSGSQGKGGDINIQAESISSTDGSNVIASTFGIGDAGNVTINARDTVSFDGVRQDNNYPYGGVYSRVETNAYGKGGNINITTGSLTVRNGAVLTTSIDGRGDAGNVNIQARDTISFAGESSINGQSSGAFSALKKNATGHGGDINITTGSLSVTNGAQMVASTLGQGDAGNVNIKARDAVFFDGVGVDLFSSGVYSRVETKGIGQGGNVKVMADSLRVTNGAVITTSTDGQGQAGNVSIHARDVVFDGVGSFNPALSELNFRQYSGAFSAVKKNGMGEGGNVNVTAQSLRITNGAELQASTFGKGKAGNVSINAHDIVLDGVGSNGFSSGVFSTVDKDAVGSGGGIDITTKSLSLTNGAELSSTSQGSNNAAGNINVTARSIGLNNKGVISADTQGGEGNINLYFRDYLIMRRGSGITTKAKGTNVTGGNITIDAKNGFIVAVPQENSDISANSDDFRGGQVKINATGIFGTQFRNAPTLLSDITATGKDSSLNGIVQINTPGIDPTRGLVQLPINLVDATQQIDNSCNLGSKYRASSFVVTGRGGLPPNPRTEPLSSDAVQVDWVTLNPTTENRSRPYVTKNLTPATPAQIIQATGWMRNAKGEVVLTADAPTATSHSSRQTPASCGKPDK
ncbi:MAG: S-layer family protein [Stigonema ocellatum SAG 48.90 = DSM 106950]|nr:S-layer family protein [Stigonema ocellatum SAG 48.90 = DSM 106950]